jgi:lipoprotein-anchoring transpeptidase ErfK/SrfK
MKDRIAALLQNGETAARAGKKAEARRDFRTVLTIDPANVPALLWFAWLNDDPRASLTCITRALSCDPDHPRALAALRWAQQRASAPESREPPAPTIEKTQNQGFEKKSGFFWVALSLLVILAGITLAWSLPQDTPVSAALVPTALPTATITTSATPPSTSTPSPVPPTTPTPPPTPTCTSLPTQFPTPSLTPTTTPVPILPTAPSFPPSLTPAPLSIPSDDVRWIDVDLTHQLLSAYEGQKLVRITSVSTGLSNTPTPVGQYHIWIKLRYDTMSGPGYYLPNVPYVMYFHGGYGLHGTTWHANFGHPMSHGCINLPTAEAEWLFDWAQIGTMVNIHY